MTAMSDDAMSNDALGSAVERRWRAKWRFERRSERAKGRKSDVAKGVGWLGVPTEWRRKARGAEPTATEGGLRVSLCKGGMSRWRDTLSPHRSGRIER
jgi:hypothetical protein